MTIKFKRECLKNGDLLVWRKPPKSKNFLSYMSIVRLFTLSDFGHVSTVWVKDNKFCHVEAVVPVVRIASIPVDAEIYVIPMHLKITETEMEEYFKDKIGLNYSLLDAGCGLLGLTLKAEDRWQCAELCLKFYRHFKLSIEDAFTPSRLVRKLLETYPTSLFRVN